MPRRARSAERVLHGGEWRSPIQGQVVCNGSSVWFYNIVRGAAAGRRRVDGVSSAFFCLLVSYQPLAAFIDGQKTALRDAVRPRYRHERHTAAQKPQRHP